jgi:FAD-linked oxidoreductase
VRWSNWSGLATAEPREVYAPRSAEDVVTAVLAARDAGGRVKMPGSGHSFTAIAAPEDTLLLPHGLAGITAIDHDAMTVTALAGTHLKTLNAELARQGLSLHNMGDIDEQTLAGAISTGTHGTGGVAAGLATQLAGFTLVTGTGEVLVCDRELNADVFDLGRVGLGALGVLVSVTFHVEPMFLLEAHERPMGWRELLGSYDGLTAEHHHVDAYWFPHTDHCMVKTNDRLDAPLSEARPPARLAAWVEDELLSNSLFGVLTRVGSLAPAVIPVLNGVAGRALSERRYSDLAHRVFTSPRRVVFKEMEYAVPRAQGLDALREVRAAIDASDWRISFPVEIRCAPADDVALSTSYGQDVLYLAFHVPRADDHVPYFLAAERIMRDHGGRPHWGKVHTRMVDDLAPAYGRFEDFRDLRNRLDPDRVFDNAYLRRVLGR